MPPGQLLVKPPSKPQFQSENADLQQQGHQPQQNVQEVISQAAPSSHQSQQNIGKVVSQVTPSSTKGQKWKRSPNCSDAEVNLLLEIWRDNNVQSRLPGWMQETCWEKVAAKMVENDYQRAGEQCKEKLHRLENCYKAVKDKHRKLEKSTLKILVWDTAL